MKSFVSFCLRRPITVSAFYILLMVLAAVAYVRLPVALLPNLRYPGLVVWTPIRTCRPTASSVP